MVFVQIISGYGNTTKSILWGCDLQSAVVLYVIITEAVCTVKKAPNFSIAHCNFRCAYRLLTVPAMCTQVTL